MMLQRTMIDRVAGLRSSAGAAARRTYLAAALWVAAVSAFAWIVAHRQLGGYDLSPLIDFQYRLSRGERPGADFIFTFPITLGVLVKLADTLPISWFALTWLNVVVFAASSAVATVFWPPGEDRGRLPVVLGILAIPVLYTGHVWHSALSQIFAVPYLLLALGHFQSPRLSAARSTVLILFAGLLFFTKQNLGPPMVVATCGAACLEAVFQKERLGGAAVFVSLNIIGVLLIAASSLGLLGLGPGDILHNFTDVMGRAHATYGQIVAMPLRPLSVYVICLLAAGYLVFRFMRPQPDGDLPIPFILACMTAAWVTHTRGHEGLIQAALAGRLLLWLSHVRRPPSERWMRDALLTAGLAAGVLPILTDWDDTFNHASLILVCLVLFADFTDRTRVTVAAACSLLALWGAVAGGMVRERMLNVGDFWQPPPLHEIQAGYFKGLQVGATLTEVRAEMPRAVAEARGGRVFCGPRIEFCYADNGLASPHGLALWWHPGTSYPEKAEPRVIDAFKANGFRAIIFLHGDRTRFPSQLDAYISANYVPAPGYKALDVFVPKP